MPVQCNCATCGAILRVRPSKAAKAKRLFCSRACFHEGKREGEHRSCRSCGASFYISRKELRKGGGQYCSRRCLTNSQRRVIRSLCVQCSSPILKTGRGHKFCTLHCLTTYRQMENHWNWKGGIKKRDHQGPEYAAWRLAIFQRDAFTCQHCGDARGKNLRAHHVRFWTPYPSLRFEVDNGLTLCERCHRRTHAEAKRLGRDFGP